MVAKLTVIFFIILFLLAGISLTLAPWMSIGLIGDWSNNFFLALAVEKTGWTSLHEIVASNWFRGAVTGFGVLNLLLAFWEMAHFKQSVEMIEEKDEEAAVGNKKVQNLNNI
ncbi:MAG TPA: hypothetical protein VNI60_04685 [Pyrinomonadaceae bacterium]|nr:hypothetical protein [Pyrinomonadaceae bacterium]